jgi:hypothetical protein
MEGCEQDMMIFMLYIYIWKYSGRTPIWILCTVNVPPYVAKTHSYRKTRGVL